MVRNLKIPEKFLTPKDLKNLALAASIDFIFTHTTHHFLKDHISQLECNYIQYCNTVAFVFAQVLVFTYLYREIDKKNWPNTLLTIMNGCLIYFTVITSQTFYSYVDKKIQAETGQSCASFLPVLNPEPWLPSKTLTSRIDYQKTIIDSQRDSIQFLIKEISVFADNRINLNDSLNKSSKVVDSLKNLRLSQQDQNRKFKSDIGILNSRLSDLNLSHDRIRRQLEKQRSKNDSLEQESNRLMSLLKVLRKELTEWENRDFVLANDTLRKILQEQSNTNDSLKEEIRTLKSITENEPDSRDYVDLEPIEISEGISSGFITIPLILISDDLSDDTYSFYVKIKNSTKRNWDKGIINIVDYDPFDPKAVDVWIHEISKNMFELGFQADKSEISNQKLVFNVFVQVDSNNILEFQIEVSEQ